jgi:imidazolonepropionase-like amidohydrolase
VGPRILASGPPITTSGGHLHWCGALADDAPQLEETIDSLCAQDADFIKIVATGGYMTAESDPMKGQYSREELVAASARAHRNRRRVAAHVLNARTIADLVIAEIDTLEHCRWSDPDGGTAYDAKVAAEIARRGIWVGITMAGIDRELLPSPDATPAGSVDNLSTLRDRHRTVREMLDVGGRIMISSDAGVRKTRFDEFALSIICAVEGVGLSVCEAIHRATLVPAEALEIAEDVGAVEGGKRADFVLVAGDPVTNLADLRQVRQVWRDGRLLVSEGRLVAEPSRGR